MSADNWDECPRCEREARAALQKRKEQIDAAYGQIPVEEFDSLRAIWESDRVAHTNFPRTFREDYEVYGADEGLVVVSYRGECTKCKLRLEFTDTHPIPGLERS